MARGFDSLTGRWLGRYDYADGRPGVAFEASLLDQDGALSGVVEEPNTFGRSAAAVLVADLDGTRSGSAVSFLKRYVGSDRLAWPSYHGTANAALTRVEGRWWFAADPRQSGRFVLMRKPRAEDRAQVGAAGRVPVGVP